MKTIERLRAKYQQRQGKVGYILLWAVGVPIPIIFLIFLLRGCQ